jgi:hypothetical protein
MSSHNAVFAFLGSEEGLTNIKKIVGRKMSRIESGGNSATYFCQILSNDRVEDVAADFIEYLLNKTAADTKDDLHAEIENGGFRKYINREWQCYLNSLKNRNRTKDGTLSSYLYKRFSDHLRGSGDYEVINNNNRLFMVQKDAAEKEIELKEELLQIDYKSWPFLPENLAKVAKTNEFRLDKKWLGETVAFYWKVLQEKHANCRCAPIAELVRYLLTCAPWLQPAFISLHLPVSSDGSDEVGTALENYLGEIQDYDDIFETRRMKSKVDNLVRQFMAGRDRIQSCILFWRRETPPVSYKDIAERLGLDNHNRVKTIEDRVIRDLKRFVDEIWPGPSADELPESVSSDFILQLLARSQKNCLET